MKKSWYQSKTVWGFGLLGLGIIGQQIGVLPESALTEVIKVLLGFFGIYGLRSATK